MENNHNKMSKEELARQIARNMAMKSDEEVFVQNSVSVSGGDDVNETKPENTKKSDISGGGAAVKTAVKTQHKGEASPKAAVKKKKSAAKAVGIASCVIIVVAMAGTAAVYFNGMNKAKDRFLANTSINGIDVSGKTQKEAYDLVMENSVIPEKITLTRLDGSSITIPMDKIGYKDNIKVTVSQYYSQQNHYTWFKNLWSRTEYSFDSAFTYDDQLLKDEIKRKIIDSPGATEPKDAYIEKTDNGFVIVKEEKGDKIDKDKLSEVYDYVDSFLSKGVYSVDLSDLNVYQQPAVTEADLDEQLDKLNSLYDIQITYDFMYTTETLGGEEILDWITFENDNPAAGYTVDEDMAMAYVEKLAEKYDTYGKDRKFKSTSRGNITVKAGKGCYGWWIDQQKTCDQLVEIIEEGSSAEVEPIYYKNPDSAYEYVGNPEWRTADSDIGNTYIEIDLAKQHFWYYEKGKLKYECDIVSGMPTEERNTPEGVYKLWIKEKDKVLKGSLSTGETWNTPVTFWNNISTFGVGLHDATWHPYFGGDRYKNYGSHGCINMPYDAAKYVYENIDMGTPVVMYW